MKAGSRLSAATSATSAASKKTGAVFAPGRLASQATPIDQNAAPQTPP